MFNKILGVSAAVVLLCCSLLPFVSFAAYPEIDQSGYYTLSDYEALTGLDLDNDYYYFIMYGRDTTDNTYISWLNYYLPANVTYADWDSEWEAGTRYKLDYSGNKGIGLAYSYFSDQTSMTLGSGDAVSPLKLNFDDGVLMSVVGQLSHVSPTGYVTNFPNLIYSSRSLEFSSTPDLSGSITRSGESSGNYYTLDTFAVTVDNYSSVDYMFSWAIVPHNTVYLPYFISPNFHEYVKSIDEKRFYNISPTFIYFSDEWVMIPAAGNSYNEVLTPSSWHKISSGGHVDTFVQFNQMQLDSNIEYDLLCFGCPLRSSGATYLDSAFYSSSPYAVDFVNDTQLFYSSTFSITDPAAFSKDNRGFGGYSWNRDQLYSNFDWTSKVYGYKDENGNTVIQENQMTDFNLSAHPVNGFNYKEGSRSNFDRLTDETDNFFSTCVRVLSLFPADCLLILKLGFGALIAIALIKGLVS